MKGRKQQYGFTLMETVLSMAIIGILGAVAVFSFSNVNKAAEFDNACEQLVTDLELARQQAIKEQKPFTVEFTISSCSYQATGVENLNGTADITTDLMGPAFGVTGMDVNLENVADPTITFDEKGNVTNFGQIYLYQDSRTIIVSVNSRGQIEISE
jgi:prepilin-type N-terminal cleavage/methylation domain-containing protein